MYQQRVPEFSNSEIADSNGYQQIIADSSCDVTRYYVVQDNRRYITPGTGQMISDNAGSKRYWC